MVMTLRMANMNKIYHLTVHALAHIYLYISDFCILDFLKKFDAKAI